MEELAGKGPEEQPLFEKCLKCKDSYELNDE